ncbi:hypothetical protein [Pedobacter frigoris]|uniref:hypothetical protein n=1 Tax=Pedobacter frigoris TaxID=2571272 RepID=UPI00292F343C|nr:hypothetical protein [Pedobacter frigoris]
MTTIKANVFFAFLFWTSAFLISSCNHSDKNSIPVQGNTSKNKDKKNNSLIPVFNEGIPLENTTSIMYPIALGVAGKDDEGLKKYRSDSDSGPYWNIAFYDHKTGVSSLLDSGRTILINSFQKLKEVIIYSVRIKDYNGDGKLDRNDPVCLFTSNLAGKNFKQITPDHLDARNFRSIDKSNIILIQAISDSNKDKAFDDDDLVTPMIFDSEKAETAKETFNSSFKNEVNKAFNQLYKN